MPSTIYNHICTFYNGRSPSPLLESQIFRFALTSPFTCTPIAAITPPATLWTCYMPLLLLINGLFYITVSIMRFPSEFVKIKFSSFLSGHTGHFCFFVTIFVTYCCTHLISIKLLYHYEREEILWIIQSETNKPSDSGDLSLLASPSLCACFYSLHWMYRQPTPM